MKAALVIKFRHGKTKQDKVSAYKRVGKQTNKKSGEEYETEFGVAERESRGISQFLVGVGPYRILKIND